MVIIMYVKIWIVKGSRFGYFLIKTKKYYRFIIASKKDGFRLLDQKYIFKSKKIYLKSPYSNKWSENKPINRRRDKIN